MQLTFVTERKIVVTEVSNLLVLGYLGLVGQYLTKIRQ
jgi:hypothetical protein